MMRVFPVISALFLMLSGLGIQANTLVSHIGSNNPLGEGFSNPQNSGNVTIGALANDQGRGAWSIDSQGASFYYNYRLSPTAEAAVNLQGWILTMQLRLVDIPDTADFGVYADYASSVGIFQMGFGTQPDGDPIVQLITDSSPLIFSLEGGGSGYHTYQIQYDPLVNAADLRIDGVLRVSGWLGRHVGSPIPAQANFGSFSNPGHANWNEFTYAIVPEPSIAALSGVASFGLALSIMRRRRH